MKFINSILNSINVRIKQLFKSNNTINHVKVKKKQYLTYTYRKIRSAARALLYQTRKHVLPDARREVLENIILQQYPQHDEVTEALLLDAAKIQVVSVLKF